MKRVLIVDDSGEIHSLIGAALKKMGYESDSAENGVKAVKMAARKKYDLILLDIEMPLLNGFETLERIRAGGASHNSNVIMVTGRSEKENVAKAIALGACDFVVKPFDTGQFLHKISRHINQEVEQEWKKLKPDQQAVLNITLTTLDKAFNAVTENRPLPYEDFLDMSEKLVAIIENGDIKGVLDAVKDHDSYTFVHSLRVGIFLSMFMRKFGGFNPDDVKTLTAGGVIHDVGKAKTPLKILNKPGGFEPEEWREMKNHVAYTMSILEKTPGIPAPVVEIAWCHHEKLDGTGYPRGLKGEEIGMLARMSAIADVYVALTDKRVYKPGFPPEKALEMMRNPGHLDQGMVKEFAGIIGELYGMKIP